MQKAATLLSELGDEEEVRNFVEEHSFDEQYLKTLRTACATMHNLLLGSPNDLNQHAVVSTASSTFFKVENSFIYRTPSLFGVLAPVEIFTGTTSLRKKTFGFLRQKGHDNWMKFAIGGNKQSLKDDPLLINNPNYWAMLAMDISEFHLQKQFPGGGFDEHHGKKNGASNASHVEVQLVLWWVCKILPGNYATPRHRIASLFELRDVKPHPAADIYVSRAPCWRCQQFKELIERITKVKIKFHVLPNVGDMKPLKNKQGYLENPRFAEDPDDEVEDEDGILSKDMAYMPARKSITEEVFEVVDEIPTQNVLMQIAIPSKPHPGANKISKVRSDKPHRRIDPKGTTVVSSPPRAARKQTNAIDLTKPLAKRRGRKRKYQEGSDNEEIYQSFLKKSKVHQSKMPKTPTKVRKSARQIQTPQYTATPFGSDDDEDDEDELALPESRMLNTSERLREKFLYSPLGHKGKK